MEVKYLSFYMWLYTVKKLASDYSGAVVVYANMSDEEKLELYQEFQSSGWE